eukprot:3923313-Alexandrium_andersonii.AAC.1
MDRLTRAVRVCGRLQTLPLTPGQSQRAVRIKVLPMGTYATEAAPCPATGIRALQAAVKRAIGTGCQKSASSVLLGLTWGKSDHNPEIHVVLRRVAMARRMWHSSSELRATMTEVLVEAMAGMMPGVFAGDSEPIVGPTG